jgi:hypothetical protein
MTAPFSLIIARTCFGVIEPVNLLANFANGEPSLQINLVDASRPHPLLARIAKCTDSGKRESRYQQSQNAFSHETSRNATPTQAADAARFCINRGAQKNLRHHWGDISQGFFLGH